MRSIADGWAAGREYQYLFLPGCSRRPFEATHFALEKDIPGNGPCLNDAQCGEECRMWRGIMEKSTTRVMTSIAVLTGVFVLGFAPFSVNAQDTANPPYLNPSLTPEERAMDLVHRMTLEEKASQMVNLGRPITRLQIPLLHYWSEALHGLVRSEERRVGKES